MRARIVELEAQLAERSIAPTAPWVDPQPNRCTYWILDTDRCVLPKGHAGLHEAEKSA